MKKILVADDKPAGRELVRTVLESCGYEVIEAGDGVEALASARLHNPDLIILDIHMPSLDGFGVMRDLAKDPKLKFTPVMALTASAMAGDRDRAEAAGFSSYMTKPIRLDILRNEAARLLKSGARI